MVFRRVGEEFAILDPRTHQLHILNPSAAAVWILCDGTLTADEIADQLAQAFQRDAGEDTACDVREALSTFQAQDLLL